MVAHGVTTIRLMTGTPLQLTLRSKSVNQEILAPTIYASSPQFTGRKSSNAHVVTTEAEARAAVIKSKKDGYDFIKVMLNRLQPLAAANRLGPLLIQLPPNMKRDDNRLVAFLEQLPTSLRWAIEFRHESWHEPAIEALLQRFNVSWVAADTDERQADCRDTADFWYVRLRRSAYDEGTLEEWAGRFRKMVGLGKSCYVYCKHEDDGSPWIWADRLRELCRLPTAGERAA